MIQNLGRFEALAGNRTIPAPKKLSESVGDLYAGVTAGVSARAFDCRVGWLYMRYYAASGAAKLPEPATPQPKAPARREGRPYDRRQRQRIHCPSALYSYQPSRGGGRRRVARSPGVGYETDLSGDGGSGFGGARPGPGRPPLRRARRSAAEAVPGARSAAAWRSWSWATRA